MYTDHVQKGTKTTPSPILWHEPNFPSISLLYLTHADVHTVLPVIPLPLRPSCPRPATMGISGILKELPGGVIKTSARVGFDKLGLLRGRLVDIDTDTLLCTCALRHMDTYNTGNYLPIVSKFQRQIISFNLLYKLDFTLVFDRRR